MTWSYGGDPANSEIDTVRYLIGDTNTDEQLVTDEEIDFSIQKWYPLYGTYEWVAASVLDTLATRYAREVQLSADGVSVGLAGLRDQFAAQAVALRNQHQSLFVGALVDVGGIDAYEQPDLSVAPKAFGTGMHDNLAAGRQDYGDRGFPEYNAEQNPGV